MEEDLPGRRVEGEELGSVGRNLIGGNTPNSSSSPPPFLFPSCPEERDEEEEVRVTVVTEEADSCSSEAFSTAPLQRSANQSPGREDGQEVTSPRSPLSQVRLRLV